jgi:hypothetical protein
MKMSSPGTVTRLAVVILLGSAPSLDAQQPAAHDHTPAAAPAAPTAEQRAAAAELSAARRRFSPELERMKSLAGRWEGTTFREREGTSAAVMTYSVTGAGSAVIETMFPGTAREMTTVYHDDSSGRLIAQHYCNAANQPKLRLTESDGTTLRFALAPDADIKADLEGHAHNLTVTLTPDGALVHDWLNHYLGQPAAQRNIALTRVR